MCMEDVQLGREAGSTEVIISVPGTSVPLIGANKNRFALVISPPPSGYITISMKGTAVLDEGIKLDSVSPPLILTVSHHGDIVTRRFSVIASAAGPVSIGVWESILNR